MTLAETAPADAAAATEQLASLRQRKKLATRRLLRQVALNLVAERGYTQVTVDDIAAAAGVSPRTFFNYFPSKEAALFGSAPARGDDLRTRIAQGTPGEPALDVLRSALVEIARHVVDELSELSGDPVDWMFRMRSARADPHLHAAHAAQMAGIERTITEALAERLGTDPDTDPYPGLLCAAATGVFRSSMTFWADSGGAVPLDRLVDLSFQALADGLPEHSALRRVAGKVTGNVTRNVAGNVTGNAAGRRDGH